MSGRRIYIGIDPGLSGGIAAVDVDGRLVAATRMPETEADVWRFLVDVSGKSIDTSGNAQILAALERVSASPQMGVVSAFTFGRGYGVLRMALLAAEIPFDEVTAGSWQKAMGVRQKTGKTTLGETHKKDKNIAKRRAQELFPGVTVTLYLADALLIAEYCRRRARGESMPPPSPPPPTGDWGLEC